MNRGELHASKLWARAGSVALAFLAILCSYGCMQRTGGGLIGGTLARSSLGLGDAFRALVVGRSAIFLAALRACDHSEAGPLDAAGRRMQFNQEFACEIVRRVERAKRYEVVGYSECEARQSERGEVRAFRTEVKDDLAGYCEELKNDLAANPIKQNRTECLIVYLADRSKSTGTLIRLVFQAELQPPDAVLIRCVSASAVSASSLRFDD
jgi:hypothetical protein